MKLASRPKNRPKVTDGPITSNSDHSEKPRERANRIIASVVPRKPPWNDMPPCQTSRICQGLAR